MIDFRIVVLVEPQLSWDRVLACFKIHARHCFGWLAPWARWARFGRLWPLPRDVVLLAAGRGRLHRCCPSRLPAGRRCCCHAWSFLAAAVLHHPMSWHHASATRVVSCALFHPRDGPPCLSFRLPRCNPTHVPLPVATWVMTPGHSGDWTFLCLACPASRRWHARSALLPMPCESRQAPPLSGQLGARARVATNNQNRPAFIRSSQLVCFSPVAPSTEPLPPSALRPSVP
jgi:hypothetical protein